MTERSPTKRNGFLLAPSTMLAVVALGLSQIVAWGTSFYALGVLGGPIGSGTGWSATVVFGGFTLAVLAASAISTPAGRLIDRYGARAVMSLGFIALGATLAVLAFVTTVPQYFGAWLLIGIAMRFTLYDAAFAAAVQVDPADGKRAIAYLTVFGGLASTVGWPVGHWLNGLVGWRETFLWFAAANIAINLPLMLLCLPRRARAVPVDKAAPASSAGNAAGPGQVPATAYLTGSAKTLAMVLFSVAMSANAVVFGVGAIHLVGIIEASGLAAGAAVALASLKGIAQTSARVLDILFGRNLPPIALGRIAVTSLVVAFAVLLLMTAGTTTATLFVIVFGASNGIATIVRGTVPLALFGPQGYGTILGILATPFLLFNALSPLGFAWIVEAFDYKAGTWALLGVSIVGWAAMEVLSIWHARHTARVAAETAAQA